MLRQSSFTRTFLKTFFSVSLGIGLFLIIRPYIAQATEPEVPLIDIPDTVSIDVTASGDQSILLSSDAKKTTVGVDDLPNVDPDLGNRYVVWDVQFDDGWQVMAYDLRSKTTIQLTFDGNNVHPVTDQEHIAWESQRSGTWQVVIFDGISFQQITTGSSPIRDITLERNILTYLQQSPDSKGWLGYVYNLDNHDAEPLIDDQTYISTLSIHRGMLSWADQNGSYRQRETENTQYYPTPTIVLRQAVEPEAEESPSPTLGEPTLTPFDTPILQDTPVATHTATPTVMEASPPPTNIPTPTVSPELTITPTGSL